VQQQQLLLGVERTAVGVRRVAALTVAPDFAPRQERQPCRSAWRPVVRFHQPGLARGEAALRRRVVEAFARPARRADDTPRGAGEVVRPRRVLATAIGVVDQPRRQAPGLERHRQGVEGELGAPVVGHRPADHPAGVAVDEDRAVEPAFPDRHESALPDPGPPRSRARPGAARAYAPTPRWSCGRGDGDGSRGARTRASSGRPACGGSGHRPRVIRRGHVARRRCGDCARGRWRSAPSRSPARGRPPLFGGAPRLLQGLHLPPRVPQFLALIGGRLAGPPSPRLPPPVA